MSDVPEPFKFEITPDNLAQARGLATDSSAGLSFGNMPMDTDEWARVFNASASRTSWIAWCGPTDEAMVAAVTGNGPTSETNAAFFAVARPVVLALLDEVERLQAVLKKFDSFEEDTRG